MKINIRNRNFQGWIRTRESEVESDFIGYFGYPLQPYCSCHSHIIQRQDRVETAGNRERCSGWKWRIAFFPVDRLVVPPRSPPNQVFACLGRHTYFTECFGTRRLHSPGFAG
ncbi:hypothetical protein DPMN_122854 [Dreissena polymorpha]|uniref:Uncharacterized protein n=1 Tax=Dreissena polymorpha TaxID=45954 RepID=A0A9D4GTC8_DREPO|nr:hypothetical protein DPMN_122854 [Dreissena polymorpha]